MINSTHSNDHTSALVMDTKQDYATAVVVNQSGEALILEGRQPQTGSVLWQIVGCPVQSDENPITAVQQEVQQYLGHEGGNWVYLGSYEEARGNVGHFFFVQNVPAAKRVVPRVPPCHQARWVSVCDLRLALLDGRFSSLSYAANVSLALFLFPPVCDQKKGAE